MKNATAPSTKKLAAPKEIPYSGNYVYGRPSRVIVLRNQYRASLRKNAK